MLPEAVASAYSGALQAALASFPADQRERREARLDAFLRRGFPHKKLEAWRYTDLSKLGEKTYTTAKEPQDAALEHPPIDGAEQLRYANGLPVGQPPAPTGNAPAETPTDDAGTTGVSDLNAALGKPAVALTVPAGTRVERPIHIVSRFEGTEGRSMLHLQHRLCFERGCEATVVFEDLSSDGDHLLTQSATIELAEGANVEFVRISRHGIGVTALNAWRATLGRNATLRWTNLDVGGALVRNDIDVALAAPGADIELSGVYLPNGTTHVDNHSSIEHREPNGRSRQVYRGLIDGKARAVFNGRIVVKPGASQTDSEQSIANLLLSPHAEVNAKPELQIDHDDVKCAHGATCGQLDEAALYYLRSRGLPLETARQLLLFSFVDHVLARVRSEAARARLHDYIQAAIPGESPTDLKL